MKNIFISVDRLKQERNLKFFPELRHGEIFGVETYAKRDNVKLMIRTGPATFRGLGDGELDEVASMGTLVRVVHLTRAELLLENCVDG
jgi:hypothetical protein